MLWNADDLRRLCICSNGLCNLWHTMTSWMI